MFALERGIGTGDGTGLLGGVVDCFRRGLVIAGETPGPFNEDAHAKPEVLASRDALDNLLADEDTLAAVPIDANIGITGSEGLGARERGLGELAFVDRGCLRRFHVKDRRWQQSRGA
jgi:hypothetical protein